MVEEITVGDEFTCLHQNQNTNLHPIEYNNSHIKYNHVKCVGNNLHGQIDVDTAISILDDELNIESTHNSDFN